MCRERTRALDGGDGMSTGGGSLNELMRRGRRGWVRLRLKGCPRCKGDLVVEVDQRGAGMRSVFSAVTCTTCKTSPYAI